MGDDLFNKLKKEGPIAEKFISEKVYSFRETPLKTYDHKKRSPIIHKESGPICLKEISPVTVINTPNDTKKEDGLIIESKGSSSEITLTPQKSDCSVDENEKYKIKSLKVRVKRTHMKKYLTSENPPKRLRKELEKVNSVKDQPIKQTMAKAQQKSFDPIINKFKIKPCVVKVKRLNLKKFQENLNCSSASMCSLKNGIKNALKNTRSPRPIAKKNRALSKPKSREKFIKKNESPNFVKLSPILKSIKRKRRYQKYEDLIKIYGKRCFNVYVRIKKCKHPLLLTFESNARNRMLRTKKSHGESKRVTFLEEVEIYGELSDTENDVTNDDSSIIPLKPPDDSNTYKCNAQLVMPTLLQKVENGNCIKDIEFDPTLFVESNNLSTSTPLRRKTKRKSLSPLKTDDTPSPRKNQLKLSNEVWLKRKNLDDEDYEDCEYIVPNDFPPRCLSQTGSNIAIKDNNPSVGHHVKTINEKVINEQNFQNTVCENESEIYNFKCINKEQCESFKDTACIAQENEETTNSINDCITEEKDETTNNINDCGTEGKDETTNNIDDCITEEKEEQTNNIDDCITEEKDETTNNIDDCGTEGKEEQTNNIDDCITEEKEEQTNNIVDCITEEKDETTNNIDDCITEEKDETTNNIDDCISEGKEEQTNNIDDCITKEQDEIKKAETGKKQLEEEEVLPENKCINNDDSNNSFKCLIDDKIVKIGDTRLSDSSTNYLPALSDLQTPIDLLDDVLNRTEIVLEQEGVTKSVPKDHDANNVNDDLNKISLRTSLDTMFSEDSPDVIHCPNAIDDNIINELNLSIVEATEKPFTII